MSRGLQENNKERCHVVWDADRFPQMPDSMQFSSEWWRSRGLLIGEAVGRGKAYFLEGLDNKAWVLRHNRRGGLLAHINHDRFLWTGSWRARALAEIRLLADMRSAHLPVPAPVAGLACRQGLFYRGDVITERIDDSLPLAERLSSGTGMDTSGWCALGQLIARFHRAGIHHADLNARNILIDKDERFYLIDFDKACRRTPSAGWCQANLARLQRSLRKFRQADPGFAFNDSDWEALQRGYRASAE